ncbi:MAG: TetR/AcrR family transcriptional regulator [Planctomycetes bacterium]|nr:TetR/AcrR family transcriptional regulator [Planctomycetota bacterium]
MKTPTNDITADPQAKRRLLDAADQLFAHKGFDATSVRNITTLAKCNVAAVNYHFQNKLSLYHHIFHEHLAHLRQVRVEGIQNVFVQQGPNATLESLVRAFAHVFFQPLLEHDKGPNLVKLMMRELTDPRLPEGMIYKEMIHPVSSAFLDALNRTCPNLEQDSAIRCLHSLIAQLIHVVQVKNFFAGLDRDDSPLADLPTMIDHIVKFSTAGIHASIKEPPPPHRQERTK